MSYHNGNWRLMIRVGGAMRAVSDLATMELAEVQAVAQQIDRAIGHECEWGTDGEAVELFWYRYTADECAALGRAAKAAIEACDWVVLSSQTTHSSIFEMATFELIHGR